MSTIQLLTKATLLIDQLARSGAATPAEIAKELDEPRPSVYRLAASLGDLGYVQADGDGRFGLGPALLRLGDAAVSSLVDRVQLQRQLQLVKEELSMGAFFCVPRSDGTYCLDQVDGSDVDLLYLSPGQKLPGSGGAAAEVLASERGVPSEGWVFEDGGLGVGVATAAVPVTGCDGSVLGAVAVAGLSGNVSARQEATRGVLQSAAGEIARLASESATQAVDLNTTARVAVKRSSSVVAKAGALMTVLETEKTATSGRLTELLGEPVSSIYRMLGTLAEVGWVEQAEVRGAYRVGLKMLAISQALLRRMDIRKIAAPIMQEIHELTGETTFLCIRHGGRAVCIERIDGVRVNSRVLQLGKSLPLHMGAAPRALLAFSGRAVWDDYASLVDGAGESWQGVSSRAELFDQLEEARQMGYVLSDNNVTPGIAAVGVPVYDHRGEVVASLSISGLRDGILRGEVSGATDGTVIDLVREGGRRLSVALGAADSACVAGKTPA